MKKIVALLMILTIIFTLLCGCKDTDTLNSNLSNNSNIQEFSSEENSEKIDNSVENRRDHQELISTDTNFNNDNLMSISIPEVGLENVFVDDIAPEAMVNRGVHAKIYLLSDYRYGGHILADHYLAITISDKIIVKDLSKWEDNMCFSGCIDVCDVDGDFDEEIILQECVGMTGGMGSYLSRVFDFKDGEIIEMFSTYDKNEKDFDTGYSITILKNKKFKIENKYTGYSETFNDVREQPDEYSIYYWYNHETGEPKDIDLWVDSFYQFSPIDIDQDGVYEILCRQYVCLVDHADGLGTAKTILKYNNTTSQFEIISTEFENDSYYI